MVVFTFCSTESSSLSRRLSILLTFPLRLLATDSSGSSGSSAGLCSISRPPENSSCAPAFSASLDWYALIPFCTTLTKAWRSSLTVEAEARTASALATFLSCEVFFSARSSSIFVSSCVWHICSCSAIWTSSSAMSSSCCLMYSSFFSASILFSSSRLTCMSDTTSSSNVPMVSLTASITWACAGLAAVDLVKMNARLSNSSDEGKFRFRLRSIHSLSWRCMYPTESDPKAARIPRALQASLSSPGDSVSIPSCLIRMSSCLIALKWFRSCSLKMTSVPKGVRPANLHMFTR
mmetsp:Transcript_8491/g.25513  ORF Transcript_8491/g.25513 Transcript_8491/m.25513 type:complete len:292 (+) Transcript_8491:1092-1967(+)